MSLKHQELYARLNAKIATSHMWGRAKDRGIPEAKSTIQDDGLTMNPLSNSIGTKQHTPQICLNFRARYNKLSTKVVFGVLALDTR